MAAKSIHYFLQLFPAMSWTEDRAIEHAVQYQSALEPGKKWVHDSTARNREYFVVSLRGTPVAT